MSNAPGATREESLLPGSAPPLLAIRDVSKTFGATKALDRVSLEIASGEIHCLLGENGAGKSTLCNVIFGVHAPDEGHMQFAGVAYRPLDPASALAQGIAMVHQHFSLVPDLSVVDNLLLGQTRGILRRAQCAQRLAHLSEQYGLTLNPFARVQDLSVGERQRVEIVKCLMREPRLLVLDEPTAVLLPAEIEGLLSVCQRVAQQGCSVVLVTHKLAEIKRVATRVTVLRAGRLVAQSSEPSRDIGELVRAMIQRDLVGLDPSVIAALGETAGTTSELPAASTAPASGDVLSVLELSLRDPQGIARLDKVSLSVKRGEIVGVAGVEGNGQSELGAILAGMTSPTEGRFTVNGIELAGRPPKAVTAAGVGVVPEDRHLVASISAMSLAENLFLHRLETFRRYGMLNRTALRNATLGLMRQFDVRAAAADAPFSSLSGGNQQKAILGRELSTPQLSLLVAAQPTRGLDVGAVEAIYGEIRAACARGVGVLLISSELDELLSVADRIVVLYRGRVMGECPAQGSQRARIGALMAGHVE